MKTSVAFRCDETDKEFLYETFGKYGMSITEFMDVLINDLKSGRVIFSGQSFSIPDKKTSENNVEKPGELSALNMTELYKLAEKHRITPQSLLNNALRPYRR